MKPPTEEPPEKCTMEVGGTTWIVRRINVPLRCILLSQPRHLLAEFPFLSTGRAGGTHPSLPHRVPSRTVDVRRVRFMPETFQEGTYPQTTEFSLLQKFGIIATRARGPIHDTPRDSVYLNPYVGTEAPERLWGGVSSGSSAVMAHGICVIPFEKCDERLRPELACMHSKNRDLHGVAEILFKLQSASGSAASASGNPALEQIYAAVDGAKLATRELKQANLRDEAVDRIEVRVFTPSEATATISRMEAFELAYRLNRVAQNTEAVSAVEVMKAGCLVLNRVYSAVVSADGEKETGKNTYNDFPSTLNLLGKTPSDRPRWKPLTQQLASPFLRNRLSGDVSSPTFAQSISVEFVKRVFAVLGASSPANVVPPTSMIRPFVQAAISGRHLLDMDPRWRAANSTGVDRVDSVSQSARPLSEARLQFLAAFKIACSERGRADELQSEECPDKLVDEAVASLLAVGGGKSGQVDIDQHHADKHDEDAVAGSSLTKTDAKNVLGLAAVLLSKPASQAMWTFGHRVHPEAARLAFKHENVMGTSSRQNRGIGKRTAKDFESFVTLSILLSLGIRAVSETGEDRVIFRNKWSGQAFRIASAFCGLFRDLDDMFKSDLPAESAGTIVEDGNKKQRVVGTVVEIVRATRLLEAESRCCQQMQCMPAADDTSGSSPRPHDLQSRIPAIDCLWESLWGQVQRRHADAFATLNVETAVSQLRLPPAVQQEEVPPSTPGHPPSNPRDEEGDRTTLANNAADGAGNAENEEVPELDVTNVEDQPAPRTPCPPVDSSYGLRPKREVFQKKLVAASSGAVSRAWSRRKGASKGKKQSRGGTAATRARGKALPARRGMTNMERIGEAVCATDTPSSLQAQVEPPEPEVPRPGEVVSDDARRDAAQHGAQVELSLEDWQVSSKGVLPEKKKEGALGLELGAMASGVVWTEEERMGTQSILASTGTAVLPGVPLHLLDGEEPPLRTDSVHSECDDDSHHDGDSVSLSVEKIAKLLRMRARRFSSLALAAIHVALTNGTKNSPPTGKLEVGEFCCDEARHKFFPNDPASRAEETLWLTVELRADGVYASGICPVGSRRWVRLLEPDVGASGAPSVRAVPTAQLSSVWHHTREYEQLCAHIAGSISFVCSYLVAFLGGSESDPTRRVGLASPRLRVVLPRNICAEGPTWSAWSSLFGHERYSFSSMPAAGGGGSGDSGSTPGPQVGVGALASREEQCSPHGDLVAAQREDPACFMLFANMFAGRAMPVSLVGALPSWDLIRVMARDKKMCPSEFHASLKRADGHSTRSIPQATDSAMRLLQLKEGEKNIVRAFAQMHAPTRARESSSLEEVLTLSPGEIGIVSSKVPALASRCELLSTNENVAVSLRLSSLDAEDSAVFEYLRPTFAATVVNLSM